MGTFDHIATVDDLLAAIEAAEAESDADVAEVLAEAAWDAAHELDPYRKDPGA